MTVFSVRQAARLIDAFRGSSIQTSPSGLTDATIQLHLSLWPSATMRDHWAFVNRKGRPDLLTCTPNCSEPRVATGVLVRNMPNFSRCPIQWQVCNVAKLPRGKPAT